MVVMRTGAFYCLLPLRRVAADFLSTLSMKHFFSRPRWLESSLQITDPLCHFSFSMGLSSAGVALLPPSFHKLPDETVQDLCRFFPRGCTFSMVKTIA